MKGISWVVCLYKDIEKTDLWKIMEFNTIKDISYILNMKQQEISNFYHKLIKERGNLRYCVIYQVA
tara:strand:+ start:319 stop:516 length:198 start_codon:yes stop_codon:yes gene_type:complete